MLNGWKKRSSETAIAAFLALPFLLVSGIADSASATTKVGTAAAVNTKAFGVYPRAARRAKVIGDNIVYNERIETSGTGLVQVLLNDGSTFTVGANSDLVIDEFVYDPEQGTGKLVATFSKGVARFVGGKLSKNKGGVSVNTPVGTIGIRGGIANLNLANGSPVFSLIFGDELSFRGTDGKRRRVYQPGYSLDLGDSGGQIRRTTQADLVAVQSGFESGSGQIGGASRSPTNRQVQNSGVPGINSELGAVRTAPVPKPKAVQSTSLLNVENQLVQIETVTRQQTSNEIKDGLETVNVRILSAGSTFSPSWDSSRIVSNPGAQGLLGGNLGSNKNFAFKFGTVTSGNATSLVKGEVEGNLIYQFRFSGKDNYFYSQTYTDKAKIRQRGNRNSIRPVPTVDSIVDGNATSYAWGAQTYNEDFVAFTHLPNVDPTSSTPFDIENMIVGVYGVGTDFTKFGEKSGTVNLRRYSLESDPTTMFSLGSKAADGSFTPLLSNALFINPLVAKELGTSFMGNVSTSDFLMIEKSTSTLDGAQFLASSFYIEGTGSAQKSLFSLGVGSVYLNGADKYGVLGTGRRGGHRIAATQNAGLYGGPLSSVKGPDGGEFFGSNAQSFIFGNDMSREALNDPYNDSYVNRPSVFKRENTISATLHAGTLDNETAVNTLTRTDRTITGYAAGALESTVNYADYEIDALAFASSKPSDLSVTFKKNESSLGGFLTVRDTNDIDPDVDAYRVRFGFNSDGSNTHRAAFIDNDTYAARDARNISETYITTDAAQTLRQNSKYSPNTYFVPNTLVAKGDDALMASANECTCAFLEWGYWGTDMKYNDTGDLLTSNEDRYDKIHLGTWVAGDVTNSASLPTVGSASYAGHAVGNVINNNSQYLAAGNFNMTVNFSSRTGNATIGSFDGKTFSATSLSEQAIATGNHFSGALSGAGVTGTMNTSLVGGPNGNHQGAIGNFNAAVGNWKATGIVAGEKQ